MTWIPVKELPLTQDLSELSLFLRQRGLVHRITDEGDRQQIWVQDPDLAEPLSDLTDQWLQGEVELSVGEDPPLAKAHEGPGVLEFPVTLTLLALSVLGALLVMTGWADTLVPWLTFQSFTWQQAGPPVFEPLSEGIGRGQIWRLFTPAFLHFGLFHILFNGLWLWELGRRLEMVLGRMRYILFVLVTATAANVAQYIWSGPALFGGMSGVVFAIIGYLWMRQRYAPNPVLAVPPGIIGFMLVYLVISMLGIIDQFIQGGIVNDAHLGGLIAGMAWGVLDKTDKVGNR